MNSDQLRRLRENLTKRWAYARHDLRRAKERREVLTPFGLRLLRRVRLLELECLRTFGRDGESAHDLFARLLDEDIAETFAEVEKQLAARST